MLGASQGELVEEASAVVAAGAQTIAVAAALLLLILRRTQRRGWAVAYLQQVWHSYKPMNKAKIMMSFYMIATRIESVYEVRSNSAATILFAVGAAETVCSTDVDAQVSLPYQVKRILSVFSITISFGLDGVGTPLECMHLRGFQYKLLMFMIAPISIALVLGTFAVVGTQRAAARCLSYREVLEAALPSFLWIMFLASGWATPS